MPADIAKKQDGSFDAITAGQEGPAWWDGSGEYHVADDLTSADIFERGVLAWGVEKSQVYDLVDGEYRPVSGRFNVRRTDNHKVLGCGMKGQYTPISNRRIFEAMDSLQSDGIAKYTSAGALGDGERVFVVQRIPQAVDEVLPGDKQHLYVTGVGTHDGSGSFLVFPCSMRSVCSNTLAIALGERDKSKYRGVRHSGGEIAVDTRIEQQREVVLANIAAFHAYNADCRKLAECRYNNDDAKAYIELLFPTPMKDGKPVEGRSATIRERKVESVRSAMRDKTNNLDDMPGTWWQLLNSVTLAVDHGNVFAFRGGNDRKKWENRFKSVVLNGEGSKLKTDAFELAKDMAGIGSPLAA